MPQNTALQAIPVPAGSDDPDIPADVLLLTEALEQRTIMRFTTTSTRDSTITAPVNGMFAWLSTPKILTFYDGVSWKTYGQTVTGLVVAATDGVNEGADVTLMGAGSFKNWLQEIYQATLRYIYDPTGTPVTVATLSATAFTLGTAINFVKGGVTQPTIHTGNVAPSAGLGVNGDVYLQW